MADQELDISRLAEWSDSYTEDDLRRAIYAASDQDTITWLTAGGKRIAKIAPVNEIPDSAKAWPGLSASEFLALSTDRRRAVIDQFYERLHGEQS